MNDVRAQLAQLVNADVEDCVMVSLVVVSHYRDYWADTRVTGGECKCWSEYRAVEYRLARRRCHCRL